MALLLQRVFFGVGQPRDFQATGCDFVALALPHGLHQLALYVYAATGIERVHQGVVRQFGVHHHLDVGQSRAVVDLKEGDGLGRPLGLYPTLNEHFAIRRPARQQFADS